MLKKADIILCAVCIALGLCVYAFLPGGDDGGEVQVMHMGEVVYRGNLLTDNVVVIDDLYLNEIHIHDGSVFYAHSDCPGGDCVHMGSISRAGGTLACLPNSTFVVIEQGEEVDSIAE